MYFFKCGDKVKFTKDWTPPTAPGDPFDVAPVPKGTSAVIINVTDNHLRLKFDDKETWPKPVIIWKPGTFPDQIDDGFSSIALAKNN